MTSTSLYQRPQFASSLLWPFFLSSRSLVFVITSSHAYVDFRERPECLGWHHVSGAENRMHRKPCSMAQLRGWLFSTCIWSRPQSKCPTIFCGLRCSFWWRLKMFEVDVDLDLDHFIVDCSKFLDHTEDHIIESNGSWHAVGCLHTCAFGQLPLVSGQDFIVMEALRPQTFSGGWVWH